MERVKEGSLREGLILQRLRSGTRGRHTLNKAMKCDKWADSVKFHPRAPWKSHSFIEERVLK